MDVSGNKPNQPNAALFSKEEASKIFDELASLEPIKPPKPNKTPSKPIESSLGPSLNTEPTIPPDASVSDILKAYFTNDIPS